MSWCLNLPGLSYRRALERKDQIVCEEPCQYEGTYNVDLSSQVADGEDLSVEEQY